MICMKVRDKNTAELSDMPKNGKTVEKETLFKIPETQGELGVDC